MKDKISIVIILMDTLLILCGFILPGRRIRLIRIDE